MTGMATARAPKGAPGSVGGRFVEGPRPEAVTPHLSTVTEHGMSREDAAGWRVRGATEQQSLAWHAQGFTPFQADPWLRRSFAPEQAAAWREVGFAADEAFEWATRSFTPEQAVAWREWDFTPTVARTWLGDGFSPPAPPDPEIPGQAPPTSVEHSQEFLPAALDPHHDLPYRVVEPSE